MPALALLASLLLSLALVTLRAGVAVVAVVAAYVCAWILLRLMGVGP